MIYQKVVLITGASSGIGKAVGTFLHDKGFKVIGTSRTPGRYPNPLFPLLLMDVQDSLSIQRVVDEIMANHKAIDVLINNAGVGITGPLEELPEHEIKANFETNFFGPITVMKAVLPHMRNQKSGLIINITSIAGYMGLPFRSIYSASKGALELITESLRMEVKPFGIYITNVAPGDFATNIAANRFHAPVHKGSAYSSYQKTLTLLNEHVDLGGNPLQMAEAVYKIIQTPTPKIHYKVGSFMQKFSVVLKRILPDKTYERLLMKHYKL